MHWLVTAIMWLAPQLGAATAGHYARLVEFETRWYKADPVVVLALIQVESQWNTRKRSRTNDYGLLQVHVARRGSSRFYGRERELYDPRVGIREGVRLLDMWRRYHVRKCAEAAHPYWAHMKWGYTVRDTRHAERVQAVVDRLNARKPTAVVAGRQ